MRRTIAISINTAWNVFNFRAGLIRALSNEGYEVLVLAPQDEYSALLEQLGCRFIDVRMDNNRTRPLHDLGLLLRYVAVLRAERPFAFLGFTVKPNVYGSLAAGMFGIPVINNIAGLGAPFINPGIVTRIVSALYRISLRRSYRVFFQNGEDRQFFTASGLAPEAAAESIPGSGVNLSHYQPVFKRAGAEFSFLLAGRLLKDKGVVEFVEAARAVRKQVPSARFKLLGFLDQANPNSIRVDDVRRWESEGLVEYLGKTDDVRPYLANADCVVLPSYREGLPRTLLEAAAMARPIITTDAAGCRDVVQDGTTGLICRTADAADLAKKMITMLRLPQDERSAMGMAGRSKVEAEYDERIVIHKYLRALKELHSPHGAAAGPGFAACRD